MRNPVICPVHKIVPGVRVCVHLMNGSSTTWWSPGQVNAARHAGQDVATERHFDWICPACAVRFPYLDPDDLDTLCIHCMRELRADAT
jgi:hypothetical protein